MFYFLLTNESISDYIIIFTWCTTQATNTTQSHVTRCNTTRYKFPAVSYLKDKYKKRKKNLKEDKHNVTFTKKHVLDLIQP